MASGRDWRRSLSSADSAPAQQVPERPAAGAGRVVWPGEDWQTATPQSQGLSVAALDAATSYAEKFGGGSGCIIRGGYLVKEWGDPKKLADIKSATKGSVGTTLLGLAVDRGVVALDDRAVTHYPLIGTEGVGVSKDRLAEITIRHLATMTAGFDDGRPPKLVYRPGTDGFYSNDSSNMLAELLTLRFGEDLAAVLKRADGPHRGAGGRVELARELVSGENDQRPAEPRVRFGHHDDAPRSGADWLPVLAWWRMERPADPLPGVHSRRDAAHRPAELRALLRFLLGRNSRGTFREVPVDAYWALGLGDSFVVVCPSLDLVVVRLGTGSVRSQLPRGDHPDDWGERVQGFFRLVVAAAGTSGLPAARVAAYPPSLVIRGVKWRPKASIVRKAKGSDNWPMTWGDDGHLYTGYGDGNGFEPGIPDKLSLGFARVEGGPADFAGFNIRSASGEQTGDGKAGRKASGLLMVEGILYVWVRNAGNSRLAWSNDHGRTWAWSDWRFTTSFGCPTFLNFGRNYENARDVHVYVYSHDDGDAYKPADRMILARVPKSRIKDRLAYEFFQGRDARNEAAWTADIDRRRSVFSHAGACYRSGVSYDAGLKRYLWCQTLPGGDPRFGGGFGIYDAPEPWGPWTTVYFIAKWDVGPGESSCFPTKWMSADGQTLHLVFSGDDSFSVRRVEFETASGSECR